MQPFNDINPEESDAQNEAVITFLKQVYKYSETDNGNRDVAEYNEPGLDEAQAIDHVRQRLLKLAQGEQPLSLVIDTADGQMNVAPMDLPINRPVAKQNKNWQQSARFIAIAAVVILLIGSSIFATNLAQSSKQSPGNAGPPISATPTPTVENRMIDDLLQADQASQYLLNARQFIQLNQTMTFGGGYQVTLDRAYADANLLIIGIYARLPYGLKGARSATEADSFLPQDNKHIRLTTNTGIKLPVLADSQAMDISDPAHEQRGMLLGFDTAGIQGNPQQVTLNLQIAVGCDFAYTKCAHTLNFAFKLPFHQGHIITVHKAVTTNGKTFTVERLVITQSETRVYIGGWSDNMYDQPDITNLHPQPNSFKEIWYKVQLSIQGKTQALCILLNPQSCPQGASISSRIPHNPGVSFLSNGDLDPVYLNNDASILGFSLIGPPPNAHGKAAVTITRLYMTFVKDQGGGYAGSNTLVDDNTVSPWVLEFTLP
jgi:hypothetical protein